MSGHVPAWHFVDPQRPQHTLCGMLRGSIFITHAWDEVTCRKCRPGLGSLPIDVRPDVEYEWPGKPGRCEMVVQGGAGLVLCGRSPCKVHSVPRD